MAAAHEVDDRLVHVVAGGADGAGVDHPAQRDHGDVGGAAADVDDHAAGGLGDRQAGADGRGHRLLHQVHLAGLGAIGAVDHGAALDLGDARRDADDQAGPAPGDAALGLADEVAQQPLGGVEVGDHAVAQRPDGGDVGWRAAEHGVGGVADGLGLVALGVDGDDGRFVDDDAAAGREHDGVSCAEVDCEVACAEGQDVEQHDDSSVGECCLHPWQAACRGRQIRLFPRRSVQARASSAERPCNESGRVRADGPAEATNFVGCTDRTVSSAVNGPDQARTENDGTWLIGRRPSRCRTVSATADRDFGHHARAQRQGDR